MGDHQIGNAFTHLHVLMQPVTEGILDDTGNKSAAFTRGQSFLGLAGKLRIIQLDRE